MSKELADQKQHRLPRTYLKHWAVEKDGKSYIWFYPRKVTALELADIDRFTTAVNEFDIPPGFTGDRRHFEKAASKIEREYDKVVRSLRFQHRLVPKHFWVLRYFVALTIVRAKSIRNTFEGFLSTSEGRDKFMREILKGLPNEDPVRWVKFLEAKPAEDRVKWITGHVAEYFTRMLTSFKPVILRSASYTAWNSADLPVLLNWDQSRGALLTYQTEIYLPLSKEFCLFLFHEKSIRNANRHRRLEPFKIHKLAPGEQHYINQEMMIWCDQGIIIAECNRPGFEKAIRESLR